MSNIGLRILVIDDELPIRKLLRVSLGAYGYVLAEEATGQEGINRVAVFKPDLLLLDLGLPDLDGKAVVMQIREWSNLPIIILTARNQEEEKIAALDAGADDYITKPFSMGELMARIRAAIRRIIPADNEPIITCGNLTIDLNQHKFTVAGCEVKLTPTEYEIIKFLAQNAGRVVTHRQLLKVVWGESYQDDSHYIRVYIGQLRRKIEENPNQPRYIITESGVGYRLVGH